MAKEEGGLLLLKGEAIQRQSTAGAIIVRRHGSAPLRYPYPSARLCQPKLTDRETGFSEAIRNLAAGGALARAFLFSHAETNILLQAWDTVMG
jgi:hypothetical protein